MADCERRRHGTQGLFREIGRVHRATHTMPLSMVQLSNAAKHHFTPFHCAPLAGVLRYYFAP